MAAATLDTEFQEYWAKLSVVEKESLLTVAKNYVELKQDDEGHEEVIKKLVRQEREKYLNGGKLFTWEEVKEMAFNKEKRDALYH